MKPLLIGAILMVVVVLFLNYHQGTPRGAEPKRDRGSETARSLDIPDNSHSRHQVLSDAPTASTLIRVVDAGNNPIGGAAVTLSLGEDSLFLGLTDIEGKLTWDEAIDGTLTATRQGFQSSNRPFSSVREREAILVLERADNFLEGRVQFASGLPVGPGFLVLAYPTGTRPTVFDIASYLKASEYEVSNAEKFTIVQTDSAGVFICELPFASDRYSLEAGGFGFLTMRPKRVGREAQDVSLEVHKGYGAIVQVLADDGEPVIISNTLSQGPVLSRWADRTDCEAVEGIPCSAVLAGLDPGTIAMVGPTTPLLLFGCSESTGEVLGPNRLRAEYPGYEAIETEFFAGSIQAIPIVKVLARQDAPGWGAMTLASSSGRQIARGRLTLIDGHKEMWFPVDEAEEVIITGIPYGEYQARYCADTGTFCYPEIKADPIATVIVGETATVWTIDDDAKGAISVKISNRNGEPYAGKATVMIAPGRPSLSSDGNPQLRKARIVLLSGNRQSIDSLRPGLHTLYMTAPEVVEPWLSVVVQPGEVAEALFELK